MHNIRAFVFWTGPGGATEAFHKITDWVNIMKTVDYIAQVAIGDAILVSTSYCGYRVSKTNTS